MNGRIKAIARFIYSRFQGKCFLRNWLASQGGSASYWSSYMVVTEDFQSRESSLAYFHWRNDQYLDYINLMPVDGQDDKVVLDYGCGPGNDLVGFVEYSKPRKLIAVDVSKTALDSAQKRLLLHGHDVEYIHVDEKENKIPLEDNSVDYIHTSGVLHHCLNLEAILEEFWRILKPNGEVSVMVYNYNSIWVHLYVAYILQIKQEKFSELPLLEAFKRSTDGPHCPISHCYTPTDFLDIAKQHGFSGECRGAAISMTEMKYLSERFHAIEDTRFPEEQRKFLYGLTFNEKGFPLHNGVVAGIDGCYRFKKS